MRNRLDIKLFITTFVIVLIGFVMVALFSAFAFSSYTEQNKFDTLRKEAESIADSLVLSDSGITYSDDIKKLASAFSKVNGESVFFVNRSGLVTVCSDSLNHKKCPHEGVTLNREVVNAVFFNAKYENIGDFYGIYDEEHFIYGVPIVSSSGDYYSAVFVSAKNESYLDVYFNTFRYILVPVVFVLIIICVVLLFISRNITRPLREISEASKAMANEDYSKRVVCNRRDEIGELADCFNRMAESLSALEYMSSSFVTNVSHDLKTPMTTISGFVDGILDGTIPHDQQHNYLTIVSDEIKRLSKTVNTMLELAKVESGVAQINRQPVDLFELVCKIVLSFEHSLSSKDIAVVGLDNDVKCIVECDEQMIYQAIYNLFDNAVKFTQRGGYISINFSENNSSFMLYIKNSGAGISESDIPHVFERFYKSDKSRSIDSRGSGVGLYIVRNIIKNHGGEITVKSSEGQYAEFCITLEKPHNTFASRGKNEEEE